MASPLHSEHPVNLRCEEARQGKTLGSVRYVLGFSLALAVVAGLVVYYLLLG